MLLGPTRRQEHGDHRHIPNKGTEFITAFIKDSRGRKASGQKCAFSAGKGKATVTIKVPAKFVPNGKWRVVAASANSKFTKFYSTPSEAFRIKKSPGVHVEITEKPEKTTDSTTARFEFRIAGAVKKIQCRIGVGAWLACTSPVVNEGLEEGQHVFKVRVYGSDSYVWTDKHAFTIQAAQTFAAHKFDSEH